MGSASDDFDTVQIWWHRISAAIPSEAEGLWFGLFQESANSSTENESLFAMYVAATPTFDPEDGGEWACDDVWAHEDRYIRPAGLRSISAANWPVAHDHAVHLVKELQPWTASSTIHGVGVGFDDGDVEIVWTDTV
jgi:hypothetical protein